MGAAPVGIVTPLGSSSPDTGRHAVAATLLALQRSQLNSCVQLWIQHGKKRCWSASRDGNGAGKGLEHQEGPGKGAQPGEEEAPGGKFSLSKIPDGRVEPGGIWICSQAIMNGMKENGLGLIWENFFN